MEPLILDALGQAVFATDTRGTVTAWNTRAESLLGWHRKDVLGRPILDFLPECTDDDLRRVVTEGQRNSGVRLLSRADGSARRYLVTSRPLMDADGTILGLVAFIDGDALYRAIVNATNEGIWLVDEASKTTYVNARVSEMLGWPAHELMGKEVSGFIHPDDQDRNAAKFSERKQGVTEVYEIRFVHQSGRTVWVRVSASPFLDESGTFAGAIGMLTDITDRKVAEDRFEDLVNQLEAIVWEGYSEIESGKVHFSFVSEPIRDMLGYEPDAWTDDTQAWVSAIVEEDRARVLDTCATATSRMENHAMEYRMTRADGRVIWVRDVVRVVGKRGDDVLMTGLIVDITTLREAKEAAEKAARLKSAILANMSHELRTPLAGIIGFADVLLEEASDDLFEIAQSIRSGGERLKMTLDSVLELAKIESGSFRLDPQPFDAVTSVDQILLLFQRSAEEKNLELSLSCEEGGILVHADEGAFSRIVTNLVHNGLKFTQTGGLDVSLHVEESDLHVVVRDSGIGISPEFLPRIFDEFEQESNGSSRSHEGVGLGLAICHRLVKEMGGTIGVRSEPGRGSEFTVVLPLRS